MVFYLKTISTVHSPLSDPQGASCWSNNISEVAYQLSHKRTKENPARLQMFTPLQYMTTLKRSPDCCALAALATPAQQAVQHLVWLGL